jgi:hypothetical protein
MLVSDGFSLLGQQVHLTHYPTDDVTSFQDAAICQQNEAIIASVEQDSASRRLFIFHLCGNFATALEFSPVLEVAARMS